MSLEQVKNIVELAEQQNIYYEVFPFGAQRIVLNRDEQWMREMISVRHHRIM